MIITETRLKQIIRSELRSALLLKENFPAIPDDTLTQYEETAEQTFNIEGQATAKATGRIYGDTGTFIFIEDYPEDGSEGYEYVFFLEGEKVSNQPTPWADWSDEDIPIALTKSPKGGSTSRQNPRVVDPSKSPEAYSAIRGIFNRWEAAYDEEVHAQTQRDLASAADTQKNLIKTGYDAASTWGKQTMMTALIGLGSDSPQGWFRSIRRNPRLGASAYDDNRGWYTRMYNRWLEQVQKQEDDEVKAAVAAGAFDGMMLAFDDNDYFDDTLYAYLKRFEAGRVFSGQDNWVGMTPVQGSIESVKKMREDIEKDWVPRIERYFRDAGFTSDYKERMGFDTRFGRFDESDGYFWDYRE